MLHDVGWCVDEYEAGDDDDVDGTAAANTDIFFALRSFHFVVVDSFCVVKPWQWKLTHNTRSQATNMNNIHTRNSYCRDMLYISVRLHLGEFIYKKCPIGNW